MVLVCPQCSARLQLDDAKAPSRPFSVRCPKCQASVNHPPLAATDSPAAAVDLPAANDSEATASLFERPTSAPRFRGRNDQECAAAEESSTGLNEVVKLLTTALRPNNSLAAAAGKRPAWDRRKALICASPAYRETIAEALANKDYEVFIAENLAQGQGRMREERMDVLVLEANFDPAEQGVAFITREVRLLRPSERRRLFLAYVTPGVRTMDLHAAFCQNVNLVVNPADIDQLPEALEVSIRHFNDLYQPFNHAVDMAPI